MHYDLRLIADLCDELGLQSQLVADDSVAVILDPLTSLRFKNYKNEIDSTDDCLIGFDGTPTHSHGDLSFYARGKSLEMSYLDVVSALVDGTVLICERWQSQELVDRWLVHKDFIDEFNYLEAGEEVRVRRTLLRGRMNGRDDG